MNHIEVPENLMKKITAFAMLTEQTPEQWALKMLEERIDHQSAYQETAYLMSSPKNRERLGQAIEEIRLGQVQIHTLYPSVTRVVPLADYVLELTFSNGESGTLDMKPYLNFGVFTRLKDYGSFQKVSVFLTR
ncbi:MAG: DUF2442 domain-containing protein [Methylococcaceae bacterium]